MRPSLLTAIALGLAATAAADPTPAFFSQLAVEGDLRCWEAQQMDSVPAWIECAAGPDTHPRRIARLGDGDTPLVLSGGSLYWLDGKFGWGEGQVLRARLRGFPGRPPGAAETLASRLDHPQALAVWQDAVFWADDHGVHELLPGQREAADFLVDVAQPTALAVTGDVLCVAGLGVEAVPLGGGEPRRWAPGQFIDGLAAAGGSVYWATGAVLVHRSRDEGPHQSLWRGALDGGAPAQLTSGQSINDLCAGGGFAYWAVLGPKEEIRRVSDDGRRLEGVATGLVVEPGQGLAVVGDRLVWANQEPPQIRAVYPDAVATPLAPAAPPASTGAIAAEIGEPSGLVALPDGDIVWSDRATGTIWRLGAGAAAPVMIATGEDGPRDLVAGSGFVAWADAGSGDIRRWPVAGGAPVTVASGQHRPHRLVLAGGALFWATDGALEEEGGSVRRLALSGGAVETIADRIDGRALAADDRWIYWTAFAMLGTRGHWDLVARILRAPLGGGPPQSVVGTDLPNKLGEGYPPRPPDPGGAPLVKLDTLGEPWALAAGGGRLYWIERGPGWLGGLEWSRPGRLRAVDLERRQSVDLADSAAQTLTAIGEELVWSDGTGTVRAMPLGGGPARDAAGGTEPLLGLAAGGGGLYGLGAHDVIHLGAWGP
ncbi:MAG: NHL repeat-containing protein [Myxococcales bacterium]